MRNGSGMITRILVALLAAGFPDFLLPQETAQDQSQLQDILARSARYCERLKGLALHFVCHEEITIDSFDYAQKTVWRVGRGGRAAQEIDLRLRRKRRTDYLYDYQLIRKGGENREKRILLRENGEAAYREDAGLPRQRFWSEFLVYGPVGFLSQSWQPYFEFEISGREPFQDRDAVLIRATPNASRLVNTNRGTIWMDEADCRILKIVWDPRSISEFSSQVSTTAGGTLRRELEWFVEYGVEKNGILFPCRQVIQEVLIGSSGRRHPKYTVTVSYLNYRFFTVETEIKY